jgi:acyl dehydratase
VIQPEAVSTQSLLDLIGFESEPYRLEVERGDLLRFAQASGATDPILLDEVAARSGPWGGLIAVPTYVLVMRQLETQALKPLYAALPFTRGVDGGSAWEYFEPIRPGDTLVGRARLADVYERTGRMGRMVFLVIDIRYENQLGQLVVSQHDTRIFYP